MKNFDNLALSFPELEDSVKQSTKGGWGGYSGDGGGWGNYNGWGTSSNPFNLAEVTITPSGGSYDHGTPNGNTTPGGNPYWGGGWSNSGNPGYGNQGDGGGSGGGGDTGGDGYAPLPTFNENVVDVIETYHSVLDNTNSFVKDAAELAGKYGDAEQAAQAVKQLKAVGEVLGHVGQVTMAYDTYVALSDGKVTLKEATKLIADVAIGELAGAIPVAGPIIAIVYTALDATGQVDRFIDWVYPDKMEDEGLDKLWDRLIMEGGTEGKTFLETFGRITPVQQQKQDMQDAFRDRLIS